MLLPIAFGVLGTTISILLAIIVGLAAGYFIRVWHHEKGIKAGLQALRESILD